MADRDVIPISFSYWQEAVFILKFKIEKGEVPEWFNGMAWKAMTLTGPVGSNPTLSANQDFSSGQSKPRSGKAAARQEFQMVFWPKTKCIYQ